MIRWMKYHSILMRRRHPLSSNTWLARILNSDLVHWNESTVSIGTAIGLFWACMPIPFQMFPAALFCWLFRGNLPIALIFVWISNPLTLPPIIYLEYRIGAKIMRIISKVEESTQLESLESWWYILGGSLSRVLVGSLVLSTTLMIVGFLIVKFSFAYSLKAHKRKIILNRELNKLKKQQ